MSQMGFEGTVSTNGVGQNAIAVPAVSGHVAKRILNADSLLPITVLYFFFNSTGLPTGLFYTTMLSPLFYVWLLRHKRKWTTLRFMACLLPFALAHEAVGIDSLYYYARSSLLLWTVWVTVCTFSLALANCKDLEGLFERLISLNFCATLIALVLLFTPLWNVLWGDYPGTIEDADHVYRLRLLTSEPSVYALLMMPLLIFVVLRLLKEPNKRNLVYVSMIAVPFLLSQSFGGLSLSLAGISVAVLVAFRHVLTWRRVRWMLVATAILVATVIYVPNPLSQRIFQVVGGRDSSTESRTVFSFVVAYTVASSKSLLWGAGLGQAKLLDVSDLGLAFTVGIVPNSVAGTLAELGIIGVALKFALEFYLFFRTRVYRNSFQLAMFVAVFVAQLTGSYMTNVQEYVMWFFSFYPLFPVMDFKRQLSFRTARA